MTFEIALLKRQEEEKANQREQARRPFYFRQTDGQSFDQRLTAHLVFVQRKRAATGRSEFSDNLHVSIFYFFIIIEF